VALLAVVGLGLQFAIGAWWGEAALGAFNLVTTAFFVMSVLGAGGVQFSVLRAIAEHPDDPARVAACAVGALLPTIACAAAATALFIALRGPVGRLLHSDVVAEGMLYTAPAVFAFAINKTLLGITNGLRRMRAFAIYTSIRYLLIGVGLVIARVVDARPAQLGAIWTLVEVVLLLVLAIEFVATIELRRAGAWRRHARSHLVFGSRSVVATLALEINSKLDIWMAGVMLTDAQVGIYSLASAIYEGALQLPVVVQNNVNPMIARGDDVDALVTRTRKWFVPAMIGALAIGVVLYPFAIPWLVGPNFAAGALPFGILCAGIAIASPWLPFTQSLLMHERPGRYAAYVVALVALAFVLYLVLIPLLAIDGAALATAIALALSSIVLGGPSSRARGRA